MRLPRQRLSQSRRLCSPLSPTAQQRDSKTLGGFILWHDPNFSRKAASAHQSDCHASAFHSRDDCAPLFRPPRGSAIRKPWEGSSSGMTQTSAAKRCPLTNEIATPVPFTVETTVLPSFVHHAAARLENLGRVHRPRMTHSPAAKRRFRSAPSWTEAAFLRAPVMQECAR